MIRPRLLLWGVVAMITSASQAGGRAPFPPSALYGIWEHDPCVVARGDDGRTTSSRATFAFFEREWGLSFSQFSDGECRSKVLTATYRGTYALTGSSERLAGVGEATLRFAYKGMAIYDAALAKQVSESGKCGTGASIQGREKDIGATGCLWVESIASCPQEYDLVQVNENTLLLGERPAPGRNICEASRRPARLRTIPLIRK